MTGDDNVTPLSSRLGQRPPIAILPRPWDGCGHKATTIDETLRTIECDDCGARLDPIEVLLGLAKTWDRWQREAKRLHEAEVRLDDRDRKRWERQRDRHLHAHPDHAVDLERRHWSRSDPGWCRICQNLEVTCPQSVKALASEVGT